MPLEANLKKRATRLIGIAFLVGGILLWVFGYAGVTPSSVNVSGYHRSDGTYVDSYSRRPPGSVAHDNPFETAEWLGVFSFCAGVYILVVKRSPGNSSPVPFVSIPRAATELASEVELAPVPRRQGIATINWKCEDCCRPFEAGTSYWYNTVRIRGAIDVRHYCTVCRDKLILANRQTRR